MASGALSEKSGSVVLSISGMTCGGCASSVTRVLTNVPGVVSAEVNLSGRSAIVAGTATPENLIAAVRLAGYDAELSRVVSGDRK
jgi:copper chaperone CopZ